MVTMQDMTIGSPKVHLLSYALPLLLGNWMQLSYNGVDSIIAGRFLGQSALAAEGIAGPVMNFVILAITGVCIGAGVLMSEAFGAKNYDKLRSTLANTVMLGGLVCIAVAILGIWFTPQILRALAVPQEIEAITRTYLRVTFLGAPFTFCYNALATGLKSVGDAKTPLKFLAFSAISNALLDVIFLGVCGFGVVCSAVTTVIAEALSAVLAFGYMLRTNRELLPRQWKWESTVLKQIILYGGPSAIQQAVQPICKILIQGQVNALGVSSIAAFNAVTRVDDFACIPEQAISSAISSAISTYIAQNRGAKKHERIFHGFGIGIGMEFFYWLCIGLVTLTLRTPIVSLFVTGDGADIVISLGSQYLFCMAFFYILPAMTNGFQGFFRGMGKLYTTLLGTFLQASLRTVFVYILTPNLGLRGIAYACAIGWCAMLLFEVPYFVVLWRKRKDVESFQEIS